MSILFSSKNIAFINNLSKCFHAKQTTWRCYAKQQKKQAINTNSGAVVLEKSFRENLDFRKNEANRSILVQVQSAQSYKELYSYCSRFGAIQNMLHYSTGVEPMHFIIVEFSHLNEVSAALAAGSYLEETHAVPVQSQFLWFRAAPRNKTVQTAKNVHLLVQNGNQILRDVEIQETLRTSPSITEQMQQLYKLTKLNEVGVRLRFLVAKQVEMAVSGMFPQAVALPFGSSVNGYGRMGCDLDLVLKLTNQQPSVTDDMRLVYHSKATMGTERSTSQRHMEAIGDILQLFLPGCSQVRRILQARVPIIKYYQQLTDIECDLSMSNTSGVHMSDFLYLMGAIDERVRPLVFTIRRWAAERGLTNSSPGRWITNFSLTLMVLSFLQSTSKPILPSFNKLIRMAGPEDKFIAEDNLNCTFLRDHTRYLTQHPAENTDSLQTLLQAFFAHYAAFDFQNRGISLNEGMPITKPEHTALYIVNPLERGLNVSKNVSIEELEKFRAEVRNAAWLCESEEEVQSRSSDWGVLRLFTSAATLAKSHALRSTTLHLPQNSHSSNKHSKLLKVSALFEDDANDALEYKSDAVRAQVRSIKKLTKAQMDELDFSQKSGRKRVAVDYRNKNRNIRWELVKVGR